MNGERDGELILTGSEDKKRRARNRGLFFLSALLWFYGLGVGVPEIFGLLAIPEGLPLLGFVTGLTVLLLGIVVWSIGKIVAAFLRGRREAPPATTHQQLADFYDVETGTVELLQEAKVVVLHLGEDSKLAGVTVPASSSQPAKPWRHSRGRSGRLGRDRRREAAAAGSG